jgi:hypothetical protein
MAAGPRCPSTRAGTFLRRLRKIARDIGMSAEEFVAANE